MPDRKLEAREAALLAYVEAKHGTRDEPNILAVVRSDEFRPLIAAVDAAIAAMSPSRDKEHEDG